MKEAGETFAEAERSIPGKEFSLKNIKMKSPQILIRKHDKELNSTFKKNEVLSNSPTLTGRTLLKIPVIISFSCWGKLSKHKDGHQHSAHSSRQKQQLRCAAILIRGCSILKRPWSRHIPGWGFPSRNATFRFRSSPRCFLFLCFKGL